MSKRKECFKCKKCNEPMFAFHSRKVEYRQKIYEDGTLSKSEPMHTVLSKGVSIGCLNCGSTLTTKEIKALEFKNLKFKLKDASTYCDNHN